MKSGNVKIGYEWNSEMPGDFNSHNKVAGSILASGLVALLGALGVTFIVAGGGGDPVTALILAGGLVFLLMSIVWLLNRLTTTSAKDCYNWVFSKNARPESEYTPRKRTTRSETYGERRPASAEDLKELKDDMRNWIPSNTNASRSRLDSNS